MSEFTDIVESIFKKGGYLQNEFSMEYRPQQERVAMKIAEMIENDSHLLAEAGTGVGKSLAYLIPGIIFSVLSGRKFIVSTHTKNLQDQLINKDVKFCKELFKRIPELNKFRGFQASLWLGKNNYICQNRLETEMHYITADDPDYEYYILLNNWVQQDDCNGIRQGLDFEVPENVWSQVSAEHPLCGGKECDEDSCFYKAAMAQVESSNVIIVNHSLVFSLIGSMNTKVSSDGNGVLFDNDIVIFDEGHTVPQVATEYFGQDLDIWRVEKFNNNVKNLARKGGPLSNVNVERVRDYCQKVTAAFKTQFEKIFAKYFDNFDENGKFVDYRMIRSKNWTKNFAEPGCRGMMEFLKDAEQNATSNEKIRQINEVRSELKDMLDFINEMIELEMDPMYVYWIEVSNRKERTIKLLSRPISVAEHLSEFIFSQKTPIAMVSATLADSSKSMKPFGNKVGAWLNENKIDTVVENSPFDYEKNMDVFFSTDCPEYNNKDNKDNLIYNSNIIRHCVQMVPDGGTMVLCTSYEQCMKLAQMMERGLTIDGRRIYVQTPGTDRVVMTKTFKEDGRGVLFGTQSFWTGVDIPGKALSQIIIVKMPFENPFAPLAKARSEKIESEGGNPFMEMMVPDAVMQFRQGLGRLIRNSKDRGRLIITDTRLLRKFYGKNFISAIPKKSYKNFNQKNFREIITKF